MSEILTPQSNRWKTFINDLGRSVSIKGCDGDHNAVNYLNVYRWAKLILGEIGNVDIPATLAFFQSNGGHCDCEILMNVDNPDRA